MSDLKILYVGTYSKPSTWRNCAKWTNCKQIGFKKCSRSRETSEKLVYPNSNDFGYQILKRPHSFAAPAWAGPAYYFVTCGGES